MDSAFRVLLVVSAVTLVVAGCGVRGSLEPPPEAKAAGTATSSEAADPGEDSAGPDKEHRGFVLDGILR